MIINEVGSGVHISYDSETTTEGARDLLKKLNSYKESNRRVLGKFTEVLGELEGATIQSYQEAVDNYKASSEFAENFLDKFLEIIELTDSSIQKAEEQSTAKFNEIEV
ncbi:hypothetical protein [Peribacillus sp. SCS-37]|uniref:hypothetical protein n=1 Tax=Paraperibacillus esterisolvens TaxID=3115296 RepID=UPI0039059684